MKRPTPTFRTLPKDWFEPTPLAIGDIVAAVLGTVLSADTAAAIAPVAAGAIEGAGVGAVGSAITGGDPGQGALLGGVTGGVTGGISGGIGGGGDVPVSDASAAADVSAAAAPGVVSDAIPATAADTAGGAVITSADVAAAGGAPVVAAGEIGGGDAGITAADAALLQQPQATSFVNDPTGTIPSSASATTPGLDATGVPVSAFPTQTVSPPTGAAGATPGPGGALTPDVGTPAPIGDVVPPTATGRTLGSGAIGGGSPLSAGGGGGTSLQDAAAGTNTGGTLHDIAAGARDTLGIATPLLTLGALGFQAANRPNLPSPTTLTNTAQKQADTITSQAQPLVQQGTALTQPLSTGQLPAGAEASVDSAVQAAKATTRSQFASLGLSGSTMEASSLANIDQKAQEQRFTIATQMAQTGLNEVQLGLTGEQGAASIYQQLIDQTLRQDTAFQNSITNFAAALAGGQPQRVATG